MFLSSLYCCCLSCEIFKCFCSNMISGFLSHIKFPQITLHLIKDNLNQLKGYCDSIASNLGQPIEIHGTDFPDVWCALEFVSNLALLTFTGDEISHLKQAYFVLMSFCEAKGMGLFIIYLS